MEGITVMKADMTTFSNHGDFSDRVVVEFGCFFQHSL